MPPANESPEAFVYFWSFTHSEASKSSGCLFSPPFPSRGSVSTSVCSDVRTGSLHTRVKFYFFVSFSLFDVKI